VQLAINPDFNSQCSLQQYSQNTLLRKKAKYSPIAAKDNRFGAAGVTNSAPTCRLLLDDHQAGRLLLIIEKTGFILE
jgi:hypothetical protein